jgi:Holliday junction resolvase RusA-like endonuclease
MSFTSFQFFVPGVPASAGSKRAFVSKTGKVSVIDTCKAGPAWRDSVRLAAMEAAKKAEPAGMTLIDEPIELHCVFYFLRPKKDYRKGKKSIRLRPDAPAWPTKPPDATKLMRALEDALNEVIWRDDALVVVQSARKLYANKPGAHVLIAPALYPVAYSPNGDDQHYDSE